VSWPDSYLLEKKIKSDNFGSTYRAKIRENNQPCIVKHFCFNKSEMVSRIPFIEREAGVMKTINNPRIPRFIDFIINENKEKVDVYLIQEYIKADNLYQKIKKGKVFTETDVIKIAVDLCKILEYLHSFSPPIIHQDIKPANILHTYNEITYLIDFGSVKQAVLSERTNEMGLSTILGTQGYMPIEQFEGRTVPGSDIYSLGLTLIFLLSKKEPLEMEKNGLLLDFRKYVDISDELAMVLDKMLHPDYKLRYQVISELEADLFYVEEEKRKKSKQVRKLYEIIRSEINETEKLRWFGKQVFKFVSDFNLVLLLITVNLIAASYIFSAWNIDHFSPFGSFIFFTAVIIDCLAYPVYNTRFFKSRKNIYVLTSKRIIIIRNGRIKTVTSYNLANLKDIDIPEQNEQKNYGNLYFVFENRFHNFTVKNIENSYLIYKIVKGIIRERTGK
jgi:serine/threonine protein kinase